MQSRLLTRLAQMIVLLGTTIARADQQPTTQPILDPVSGYYTVTLESDFQSRPTVVQILLPDTLQPEKKYPVLYILPVGGNGKEFGDGLDEAKKAQLANKLGVICVTPYFATTPWYGNHATDPKIRQEDYLIETVVPFIDRTYPTQAHADGRWLIGFSKSGWGAFTLLMRHRDVFGYAAAWDAPFMIDGKAKNWGPMGLSKVMGTSEQMQQFLPTKLAADHAAELKGRTRLVVGVGEFWRPQCIAMHDLLTSLKVPHTYRPDLVFKHRWDTGWFVPMADELAKIARAEEQDK